MLTRAAKRPASRSTAAFPRVPFSALSALLLTSKMSPTWRADTTYNFTCTLLTTPCSSILPINWHRFTASTSVQLYIRHRALYRSRRLELNANKTEAILFGSKPNLAKLSSTDCSMQVGTSRIQPSAVVCDLGFHLNRELCMKQNVAKMAAACFYHLRRLSQISRRVGEQRHHPASYCSSHISVWLLQFFASRASTLYNRTAPTHSERRCSTNIRTQSVRAHHTKPTPVILATHTLARPV